eukprot:gnl/TRDRNA2_/TRDRNA2_213789_c0_seq1.p1 gnl/TRDRNA2_/TRDRNA2_213789_c0~~gnl/TRDRNA2_/TRDRNA2_213789_c0_seq1.p1  ORF type:complete len:188 (+),score=26.06 gnl/TRDRNA2_/TRDRNA2_213789_c0_seq1:258-821(+)
MLSPEDDPLRAETERMFQGQEFYEFARTDPKTTVTIDAPRKLLFLDEALALLQEQLHIHAPIDGVLGFSQGANMASLLAAQAVAGEGAALTFVVHLCPARPGWVEQRPDLFQLKLPIRSLHISGEKDPRPPLPLLELYKDPLFMMHSDGHKTVPSTSVEEANRVAGVIADFVVGTALPSRGGDVSAC